MINWRLLFQFIQNSKPFVDGILCMTMSSLHDSPRIRLTITCRGFLGTLLAAAATSCLQDDDKALKGHIESAVATGSKCFSLSFCFVVVYAPVFSGTCFTCIGMCTYYIYLLQYGPRFKNSSLLRSRVQSTA